MMVDTNSVVEVVVEHKTDKDVQTMTSKTQSYCKRVSDVSQKNAMVLKKHFPAFYGLSSTKKRKFNPMEECVVADQQKKKKAVNTRTKPRVFHVVFLSRRTIFVPRGYQRSKLASERRVLKIEFRRNMSSEDVRSTILDAFSSLSLEKFLKCGQDNQLKALQDNDLNGDGIFDLAGQGSVYIVSDDSTSDDSDVMIVGRKSLAGETSCASQNTAARDEREVQSPAVPDKREVVTHATLHEEESDTLSSSYGGETLEEWRAIRDEQDRAYDESLQAYREKARKKEGDAARKKRVNDIRF